MIDAVRVIAALVMTLLPVAAARADGDAARGEVKFQDCAACHKLEAGANNLGPSLHGIFERKAGELADFRYSPAIKRGGITWTPETLDKFITDPQAMVPGNRMPYAGMASASDRADLIA
jgi:cytochrome c